MATAEFRRALGPARLGGIELRNRVIKAGAYEGMCPGGEPSDALIEHHVRLARGGVGMTTVAYCAVSPDGRTFPQQMHLRAAIVPKLRELTAAVHAEGTKASLQLGHCGFFSRNREVRGGRPFGPSWKWNMYGTLVGMPLARPMTDDDIVRTVEEFGGAAELAVGAGFDAVELHLGHGYLLSQFLSPWTNRREDRWGGSPANRLRFPLEVVREVRRRVGAGTPILCKMNLRDGFVGGLEVDEAAGVAQALEAEGVAGLVLSGGFTSRDAFYLFRGGIPLRQMIEVEHSAMQKAALALFGPFVLREHPFGELYFLDLAKRVRAAVGMPLGYLGGVVSRAGVERAMREGFDFVVLGRALVADPDLVERWGRGDVERSRCNACNRCVAEMDRPGGVRCVLGTEG
ncbi:MAG: NADH:flavin oxidoreductase [Deltaproteobacteria bacterium]|nr:NADH:flavin oxidoreductase [Deltaproteobacteria bacterium]